MEEVGTLLWEMRTTGGLSLGRLAQKAGISKAALSQWETGKRKPRVPELEAVLGALSATPAQRALAFSRIQAPRAIRHLRRTALPLGLGLPPTSGDLIQAMRLRKGWSQARLAERLHVTRPTVTQWERSDRLPSQEHLHALCYALGAREEEVTALTCGHFAQRLPNEADRAMEVLASCTERYWEWILPGTDLEYLDLIARTWKLAVQDEAAKDLLARAYLMYADYLSVDRRWKEIGRYAGLALQWLPHCTSREPFWIVGGVAAAHHAVYGGNQPAPDRGLLILERWLPLARDPISRGWIESRMAEYLFLGGAVDAAIARGAQACRTAEETGRLQEVRRRRKDQVVLLTKAGLPAEALSLLPPSPDDSPYFALDLLLLHAKAYLALGERPEALRLLEHVQAEITASQLLDLQPTLDQIARQF